MKKVLIIDDEEDVLFLLKDFIQLNLKGMDLQLDTCQQSMDALLKITETKYNLIITDHKMPKMLGSEFLYNLRNLSSSRNKQTPTIILSGYVPEAKNLIEDRSSIYFLDKPFNPEQLKDHLKKLI